MPRWGQTAACARGRLSQHGLVLALGAVIAVEAAADARRVVAQTAAGAVATSLVTETLEHIGTRGAFNCAQRGGVGLTIRKRIAEEEKVGM